MKFVTFKNFVIKGLKFRFAFAIISIQKCYGISNRVPDNREKYYIFWDLDGCTLEQAETELKRIQVKYNLSNIIITGDDSPDSFRAYCWSKVSLRECASILLETKYTDVLSVSYLLNQKYNVLRFSPKVNRNEIRPVAVLRSYYAYYDADKVFSDFNTVVYETHRYSEDMKKNNPNSNKNKISYFNRV